MGISESVKAKLNGILGALMEDYCDGRHAERTDQLRCQAIDPASVRVERASVAEEVAIRFVPADQVAADTSAFKAICSIHNGGGLFCSLDRWGSATETSAANESEGAQFLLGCTTELKNIPTGATADVPASDADAGVDESGDNTVGEGATDPGVEVGDLCLAAETCPVTEPEPDAAEVEVSPEVEQEVGQEVEQEAEVEEERDEGPEIEVANPEVEPQVEPEPEPKPEEVEEVVEEAPDAADGGDAAGEPDGPGEEPDAGPTTTKFEDATVTQQSVDTGEGQPKYTYPYGTEALQTSPKFIGDPNNALAGYYISPCVYPVPLLYQYNSETNEGIPFNFGDPALSFVDMMLDQSNYPMALGAVGLAPDNLTKPMLPDNNGAKWVLELDPMTEFTGQPESWAVNAAGEKIAKIVADTEGWVDLCQVVSGAQICWRYPAAWDVPLPQSLIDLGLSACPVNTEVKP